jgi:hypothetical protein
MKKLMLLSLTAMSLLCAGCNATKFTPSVMQSEMGNLEEFKREYVATLSICDGRERAAFEACAKRVSDEISQRYAARYDAQSVGSYILNQVTIQYAVSQVTRPVRATQATQIRSSSKAGAARICFRSSSIQVNLSSFTVIPVVCS